MARVKRGVTAHARHKKVLKLAKGYRGRAKAAFRVGIEGGDIPLGAAVSLFMVPILAVAATFILRDITKRGSEV